MDRIISCFMFFFQAEDGIRDIGVTRVQTCALPISLGVRFNGTDWEDDRGITPADAVAFARALKALGCDYVDVSSGGNGIAAIPMGPGYQVPFAARIRREVDIATMAVGLIRDPQHAERLVADGDTDLVAIGRGIMNDPRWPWHAAEELGATVDTPIQYARGVTRAGIGPHFARATHTVTTR